MFDRVICTVLMPVYNGSPLLRYGIESILAQDESDFEFLIIEDCSTDNSAEVIRKYAARDRRIRAVFHEKNEGLAATLNDGLRRARSDLVVRMDHDDEALPQRISTQVRFLREHPDITAAGSFVYHMGSKPAFDRLIELPIEHEAIAKKLPVENCMYHPSMILRRERVLAEGGYRTEFENSEDYDLWLRLVRRHRLANIPVPLLRYRFSPGGMTLGRKWQQMYYAQIAMISYASPEMPLEEVAAAAEIALQKLGKDYFLKNVAMGTVRELTKLRLWGDAMRVAWNFSRELPWNARAEVFQTFARQLRLVWSGR